jgi:Fic family protein
MLNGIEKTAAASVTLITSIKELMQHYKQQIRSNHSKLYSQDLLNNLFKYPYTKIEFLQNDLQISRSTAIRYLDTLVKAGFLTKHKVGRDNFFLNTKLFELLAGDR